MRAAIALMLCLVVVAALCAVGCTPKPSTVSLPSAPPEAPNGQTAGATPPAAPAASTDLGEQIAKTGVGASGQHIEFTGGSDRFKSKPGGCLGCHNEDGRGRTTPKGKIPAINYTALRGGDKPIYPTDDAIIVSIRDGKDEKGESLAPAMPRWKLTDAEATALIGFLKKLDSAPPAPAEGKPEAKPAEKPAPPAS